MACVGIIGGLGVGATVHYYEKITAACKARGMVPDLVFVHADVDRGQGFVRAGKLDGLADYLAGFIERMAPRRRRGGGRFPPSRRTSASRSSKPHRACR